LAENPYDLLGVEPTASATDIQKAYRKLAKKYHPDLNPGDKTAEDRFKDISAAYNLLGDAEKRKRFDAGEIDASGAERPQQRYYRDFADVEEENPYASNGAYSDFMGDKSGFAELLRRAQRAQANRRGEDIRFRLPIELLEAISGANKRIALPDGGTLDVTIPPGMADGQVLRLKGKGAPGTGKAGPGDALIEVEVLPDDRFTPEGDNILLELPISLSEAVLGGQIRVPTPTGDVTMSVPKGSNTGTTLRLRGKGAPRRGGGSGDELVKLKVVLPKPSDPELEAFVSTWAKGKDHNPREGN
jgi:DnaJ-class molecular chaperone